MKQDKNLLCTIPQSALQEEILIENTHTHKEKSFVHTTDKTKEKGGKKVNTVITIEMSQSQLNLCVLQDPVERPCPSLSPPAPVPVSHHLPLSQSFTTYLWDSHSEPTSAHSEGRELIQTGCTQHVAYSQLVTHMYLLPGLQCPHLHHHYCHTIQSVKAMTGKTLYSKILQSFL